MRSFFTLAVLMTLLDPLSLAARGRGPYLYESNTTIYDYHDRAYYKCHKAKKYQWETAPREDFYEEEADTDY